MALGRHAEAAVPLVTVLSLSPGDTAAQALLHEVERGKAPVPPPNPDSGPHPNPNPNPNSNPNPNPNPKPNPNFEPSPNPNSNQVERKKSPMQEAERAVAWEAAARGAVGEVVEREPRAAESPVSSREFVTGATPPPPATEGS